MESTNRTEPVNPVVLGNVETVPAREDGVRYTGAEQANEARMREYLKSNPASSIVLNDFKVR